MTVVIGAWVLSFARIPLGLRRVVYLRFKQCENRLVFHLNSYSLRFVDSIQLPRHLVAVLNISRQLGIFWIYIEPG